MADEERWKKIREQISEENPDALFADGFDAALLGPLCRCGQPTLAAYSYQKGVEVLMRPDDQGSPGMSYEDAIEWMDFNVVGAWVGENTPAWVMDLDDEDA